VCLTCLLPSALASSLHTASYAAIHSRENTENSLDSTEIEDVMMISLRTITIMQHIIAAASNPNITTAIIVVIAILAYSTDPKNSLTNRKLAWIRLTVVMPAVTIVATM
jgi:hypothetical protein